MRSNHAIASDTLLAEALERRCLLAGFPVPQGVDGTITDMQIHGDVLYFVGDFTRAGDIYSPNAAAYDLKTGEFKSLGGGLGKWWGVKAIEVAPDGTVYVGGSFSILNPEPGIEYPYYPEGFYPGSNPPMMLAKLAGEKWIPLGTRGWTRPVMSPNGNILYFQPAYVTDIEVSGSGRIAVQIAGHSYSPGGSRWIWEWNGESWDGGLGFKQVDATYLDGTFFYANSGRVVVLSVGFSSFTTSLHALPNGLPWHGAEQFLQIPQTPLHQELIDVLPFSGADVGRWKFAEFARADRVGDFVYATVRLTSSTGDGAIGLWRFDSAGGSAIQIAASVPSTWSSSTPIEFNVSEWGVVASTDTVAVVFTRPERLSNPSTVLLTSTVLTGSAVGWKQGVAGPDGMLYLTQDTRQTNEGTATGIFRRSSPGEAGMLKAIDDRDGLAAGVVSVEEGAGAGDPVQVVVTTPDDIDLYEVLVIAREGPTKAAPPVDGTDYSGQSKIGADAILTRGRLSLGSLWVPGGTFKVSKTLITGHTYTFDLYGADAFGHYTLMASVTHRAAQPVVMYVPNFLGSLPRFDLKNQDIAAAQADEFMRTPGFDPARLYPEQIDKSANKLLEVFDGVPGYRLSENLIFATYDWRLPVAPLDPDAGKTRLAHLSLTDSKYEYAAEYLAYWMERAKDGFIAQHGDLLGFRVHVVAHGSGGIVARAFLQSDLYQDQYAGTVRKALNIGVPHLGFVDAFYYRNKTVGAMLDGLEPRADADSVKYVQTLREAAVRTGIDGTPVPTWIPGIVDYMPTFDFIKRGPDGFPPPAGTYDNTFLKHLNADPAVYTSRIPQGVRNVYSTGVDTPFQVYYSFGDEEARSSLEGDGLVLVSSATPPGLGIPATIPFTAPEPTPLDQRDLINHAAALEFYRKYASIEASLPTDIATGQSYEGSTAFGSYFARTQSGFNIAITYLHVDDLEIPSFGPDDLTITSPTGALLASSVARISDATVFGPVRTVVYAVSLPTSEWRAEDFGMYRVDLREGGVRTYKGDPIRGEPLGFLNITTNLRADELADRMIELFGSASVGGFVSGDWIERELNVSVPGVARGQGYWGGVSYWFQNSAGETWTLWHGGSVHASTTRAGEMRWLLTNLTEAAGLTGQLRFVESSLSGIVTGWNAFNVQGIMDGKLWALWWSPEGSAGSYVDTDGSTKQGKAFGLRGNGWVLSSISDALTPINGAVAAPPAMLRPFSFSQGNSRTDFDPRSGWYTANNGMSVIVVDASDRVYAATFNVWQRDIPGADPGLNGKWLIERLGDLPSLPKFGVLDQLGAFEQQYIAASKG
jgi:hypothetical protein